MLHKIKSTTGTWVASAFALTAFYLFTRVGHLAGPYFKVFSLLEFLGAFAFVFLFYRLRYFAAGFAVFALPRVFSITLGRDSHNLLFCIFAGMSLALLVRAVLKARDSDTASLDHPGMRAKPAALVFVFTAFLLLRALAEYYGPGMATLTDRTLGLGVSANYAFYLSLLVGLNLMGPLLFIMADAQTRETTEENEEESHREIARGLLAGFALGAAACLAIIALQELGVKRLFAGSARSLEHFRPPGLFTDSGSAAVLLPVLIYCLYLFIAHRPGIQVYMRRAAAGLLILILCLTAIHQGRGYILSSAGLALGLLLIYFFRARGKSRRVLGAAFIAAIVILPSALWLSSSWIPAANRLTAELAAAGNSMLALDPAAAYARLDPVRANLFRAGVDVFREHSLIGSGLNSFMAQTAHLARAGKIAADNPAMLFLGVLSDVGILGSLILVPPIALYMTHLVRLFRRGDEVTFRVYILPLFCLPAFFIGHHVVFAEFCAFLLMPMLFWPRTWAWRNPITYVSAGFLAVYVIAAVAIFLIRNPS